MKSLPSIVGGQNTPPSEAIRVELARTRVLCRAWTQTLAEAHRAGHAALFVRLAMESLAREVNPSIRLSDMPVKAHGHLDNAVRELAKTFGRDAAQLPLIEALHLVTSLYPALLSDQARSSLGAYYTPPVLVRRLIDQATEVGLDWTRARALDPAAGAGAFLIQVALRMKEALIDCEPSLILKQIGTRLVGFEIDPFAAGVAQSALEIALADVAAAAKCAVPSILKICDTLEEPATEKFDLVIGNPPYGRVTLTPTQRCRYERGLYGHANLYGVFTDVALRWATPKGLIGYLTPTSFLAGQYYAALRDLLAKEAPPAAIDFVHARRGVFEDVLQETLLAVYRKGEARGRAQIHYLHVSNEIDAVVKRNGTIELPPDPGSPWLAPRDAKHSPLIAVVEKMSARLSSLGYSVSTGPLVWNRFKDQLREDSKSKNVYPLIWAEAVTADGRFIFRSQKKNHSPYFKLERGDAWLLVKKPCVLLQRTTAKEQSRRLIAAELPASFLKKHKGLVIENHLNMVQPTEKPAVPLGVIAALLNSVVVDEIFRCMSGSVAVSAFELEALPMPSPKELKLLTVLVAKKASREKIEAECRRLYGDAI
jgi:adenine-specific DNA-methyltransferase